MNNFIVYYCFCRILVVSFRGVILIEAMFVRKKKSGRNEYLQLVHNERIDGKVRQRVIATLGRTDELSENGRLEQILASLSRFAAEAAVLTGERRDEIPEADMIRIGPALVFERLWRDLGIGEELDRLLHGRRFEFPLERAIFLTVLHRLFAPDRAAESWRRFYRIEGAESLSLHHLYRAMAYLGEVLPDQVAATPFAPRTTKDSVEEALFARHRDLFSSLDVVFFDTTSLYFEGEGGEDLGRYGNSKDHRPDCKQIVVGAVLDQSGRPFSSEFWPGNTTDVKTLIPVLDRLRHRFGAGDLCVVADRGMISKATVKALDSTPDINYILGVRMRSVKEVREEVLSRPGRYREVRGPRASREDPAPLKVKEVRLEGRRYIVCYNENQAAKDRADREAIVAALRDQLKRGDKSLVGNKGYRRYLKTPSDRFEVDEEKIRAEARYDGKWILETDLKIDAADVALRYKELWRVEALFRTLKSTLNTRPIYHQSDAAIRGHVFCSFLALLLLYELRRRMEGKGWPLHWDILRSELDALEEIRVENLGRTFSIRSRTLSEASKALRAAGVALGPALRFAEPSDA